MLVGKCDLSGSATCRDMIATELPMRAMSSVALLAVLSGLLHAQTQSNTTLTAVPGIKVGHHTLTARPTGCTVILVDGEGVAGGVAQRGGAPGTRETDLLDPANLVDKVNAVVLAGGSAFGLEAATGTVKWLEEHNIGRPAGPSRVPIVPGAILFDLGGRRGNRGSGRRRLCRRRRRCDRRQARRARTVDEGGHRHRGNRPSRRSRR